MAIIDLNWKVPQDVIINPGYDRNDIYKVPEETTSIEIASRIKTRSIGLTVVSPGSNWNAKPPELNSFSCQLTDKTIEFANERYSEIFFTSHNGGEGVITVRSIAIRIFDSNKWKTKAIFNSSPENRILYLNEYENFIEMGGQVFITNGADQPVHLITVEQFRSWRIRLPQRI